MVKGRKVSVWYDREGDCLEVMFEKKAGFFRETSNDSVMEKVDKSGHVLGFQIMKVSKANRPMSLNLAAAV